MGISIVTSLNDDATEDSKLSLEARAPPATHSSLEAEEALNIPFGSILSIFCFKLDTLYIRELTKKGMTKWW